jgi:dihydrofolate synthase/folylpolyglutamate synthase
MNYEEAIAYILSFADWERTPPTGGPAFSPANYDLRRVHSLLARLGDPHRGRSTVHIAGSKGKGSVAAMIASILRAAGHRVGLYTSPHLHSFRERIAVDGAPISEGDFARLTETLAPHVAAENADGRFGELTTFELVTALAFLYFREVDAQWQVLEVGMGGRLDATNVLEEKSLCVITPLSLEHTSVLGDTVAEIAGEKAAILRRDATTVLAPQPYDEGAAVVRQKAAELDAPLVDVANDYSWERRASDVGGQTFSLRGRGRLRELRLPLLGGHQRENAATAVAAVDALRHQGTIVSEEAIAEGLGQVSWPGRLEVLRDRPLVVADGAHNGDSARRLREALAEHFSCDKATLVIGASGDKTVEAMAGELAPIARRVIATRSRHPRAAEPGAMASAFAARGVPTEMAPTVAEALDRALAVVGPEELVCVVGSLFVVAEGREHILGISVATV